MNDRIYLSPPSLTGNEMAFIEDAFQKNVIAPLGENVDEFESDICSLVGVRSAAALSSGSAAILLSLKALGVGPGDAVFCSDLTFAGSCFPILHLGARPVFIDSEPKSCNMSPRALEKALSLAQKQNQPPKAVIIVDLYGNPADYYALLPICEHYGVPVVEDAAEALGARYHGQSCGTFGDIGVFSFNGNKIITTSGGGMAISDQKQLIEKIRFWSAQSRESVPHYEHRDVGYNCRMSNICAGIGRGQITGLKEKIAGRKRVREYYTARLSACPVRFLSELRESQSNYWLSVMLLSRPDPIVLQKLAGALEKENIESRPFWKPMHEQPVFHDAPFVSHFDGEGSVGSELFRRGICLPSGETLTEGQLDGIISTIQSCL